ncbi:hypothetical protein GCM10023340_19520 [Nocardioides marinquilinus]|uniref:Uncharacterized protein n=1 Tax=Nocardioides marinquilinus TaxID=1210400 RepID=A0ABP9PIX0_9ACTN
MSKGNRKRRKKAGLLPTPERCVARNRKGEPCKKYPIEGAVVCATHGGSAPQVRRKAQERIFMAQDGAASVLVRFMSDDKVPYAERRRCAEFLLTYENRNEVKVMIEPWQEDIEGILVMDEDDDIVDAEVVQPLPELSARPHDDEDRLPSLLDDPPNHQRHGPRLR